MSLVMDLFPNVVHDKMTYGSLEDAIKEQTEEQGLIYHEPWVLKLIQVLMKESNEMSLLENSRNLVIILNLIYSNKLYETQQVR